MGGTIEGTSMTSAKFPARTIPLLYLSTAHASLALATLFTAFWPQAVAGFFYHSWMLGVVHLVTLGWITFSIIGAIYIVGPLALRMEMPARRLDYVGYAFALVGLIGMVGHFWIQEYAGMAWSASMIACAILYTTIRIVLGVRRAVIEPAVKLHITLACINVWVAASMGLLIAFDKAGHFLPGFVLSNVFAHAHLAALGWATMMVVGVGYRLLPMTIPSKMPSGGSLCASAILLETGVLGLFTTLLIRSAWTIAFGLATVAGLLVFAAHVLRMLHQPVSKPVGAPRFNFGLLHAAGAGASLGAAAAVGLALLIAPTSSRTLHAAAAYGVLGLVGFLAQMVVAMEARLLPIVTWFWTYAGSGYRVPPPAPRAMRDRSLQAIVYGGWTIAVPALAAGMFLESARFVSLGAWALFVGVAVATLDNAFVVAYAVRAKRAVSREAA
jgi:hypothetical protein